MAHNHRFIATDIPGVSVCRCGGERYFNRDKQEYITIEREEER
jgi:hypothetical protein